MKHLYRTPKGYDGTEITTRKVSDILTVVLSEIGDAYHDRPDLILAAWPEVIGHKLAPMTQAVSFQDGVLVVKVMNSTLYSLLSQHDKPRIISSLRQKFPKVTFSNIVFRIG